MTALTPASIPAPVLEVVRVLQGRGFAAYLVGGCVRDLSRGQTPKDFDVATSALPQDVQAAFRKVIPTGIEHGTVTVLTAGEPIEVTTFRTEGAYIDGRRPSSVSFDADLTGDLSRRDFTINAMAYDPLTDERIDPFGGAADLAAGIVRCVGEPHARFGEDGLRALRAVRFATTLGFELDPATCAAIPSTLPTFRKIALERVQAELVKLLLSGGVAVGLQLLEETGLLATFLPEAVGAHEDKGAAAAKTAAVLELRLATWLEDVPRVGDHLLRLKFPRKVADTVALLVREAVKPTDLLAGDTDVRRWMARAGSDGVGPLLEIAKAKALAGAEGYAKRVHALLAQRPPLRATDLALNGKGIMAALNVGPSPVVGEATRHLLEQVLEHPEWNTPERLRSLLASFANRQ